MNDLHSTKQSEGELRWHIISFLNAVIPLVLVLPNMNRMDLSKEMLKNLTGQRNVQLQPPFDSCNGSGSIFNVLYALSKYLHSIPCSGNRS